MSTRATPTREWRESAACRDSDPELFFPAGAAGPAYEAQVAAAKAVCAGCPVRAECLAEALVLITYGVAGGLTEDERRRARTAGSAGAGSPRSRTPRDRRSRAVTSVAGGRSCAAVAMEHGVSERTVQRWARDRACGDAA